MEFDLTISTFCIILGLDNETSILLEKDPTYLQEVIFSHMLPGKIISDALINLQRLPTVHPSNSVIVKMYRKVKINYTAGNQKGWN